MNLSTRTKIDFSPKSTAIATLKQLIAEYVVFFPPSKLCQHIQKYKDVSQYPYLIFAEEQGQEISVYRRMVRKNKQLETTFNNANDSIFKDKWKKLYVSQCLIPPQQFAFGKGKYILNPNTQSQNEIIYVTDNGNSFINKVFKNACNIDWEKGSLSICHIGGDTVHKLDYFAAIPNIVYLPRWLESVTDHSQEIRLFLCRLSYWLYFDLLIDVGISRERVEMLFEAMSSQRPSKTAGVKASIKQIEILPIDDFKFFCTFCNRTQRGENYDS